MPKQTKVAVFLAEMNTVIPWSDFLNTIRPFYKTGEGGRPAQPLERMLRIYFLQLWYTLSDPAMEDELYEKYSFQQFVGLDGFTMRPPDETTILNFRHLLEEHDLAQALLDTVNVYLATKDLVCKQGTITDATLIHAPSSTKNKEKKRDPEMSSTQKNNQWYFGAKGHIGVQAKGKPIIHTAILTTAKTHDYEASEHLLHGKEQAVFGDSAYTCAEDKRMARGLEVYYGITDRGRRGKPLSTSQKKKNRRHASLRAKVEHPFRIIKVQWGWAKVAYRGLKKNACRFVSLCALANVYMCRKLLLA